MNMLRSLFTASTGLQAQQLQTDIIANNIANVNTPGFKRDRLNFQDLIYQVFRQAGHSTLTGAQVPSALRVGLGVRPIATQKLFSEGVIQPTGNTLDLAIMGDGFFTVLLEDGRQAYTRDGSFKLNGNGEIVTADGLTLDPVITIPPEALRIEIASDGNVGVEMPGETEMTNVGQIQLARFQNPTGLNAIGRNLFLPTAASGDAQLGTPNAEGFGTMYQSYLELSNVNIVEELVQLIIAQRAFETNSRAVDVSDQLLSITNNLAR
jgi:flagellar basal-body rod protein FlgG